MALGGYAQAESLIDYSSCVAFPRGKAFLLAHYLLPAVPTREGLGAFGGRFLRKVTSQANCW